MKYMFFTFNLFLPFAPWIGIWFPGREALGHNIAIGECLFFSLQAFVFMFILFDEDIKQNSVLNLKEFSGPEWKRSLQYCVAFFIVLSWYAAGWWFLATVEMGCAILGAAAAEEVRSERKKLKPEAA